VLHHLLDSRTPEATVPHQPDAHATHALLEGFPAVLTLPVQWGEMDAYGHVNNTVFFRYFESARIAYLDLCGFLESYDRDRVGAILHSTSCRFRAPVFHPDTVQVGARAVSVEDDRFTMQYRLVSFATGTVVAEGQGIVVAFDYRTREKTALPPTVREQIRHLDGLV
jgi:acyl-CoA thioester hydrolase